MIQFKKLNTIIGWSVFLIASFVYLSTIEQTVSFWDCGEYIATAYKLEVGHPPGAPLFQLFGRIFTLLATDGTSEVAVAVNILSALCSAFTILFLFWTITAFGRKLFLNDNKEIELGRFFSRHSFEVNFNSNDTYFWGIRGNDKFDQEFMSLEQ